MSGRPGTGARPAILWIALAGLILSGCSAQKSSRIRAYYDEVDLDLAALEYDDAIDAIHDVRDDGAYGDAESFLYHHDLGMAHLYAGRTDSAVAHLRRAEDIAEERYAKSMTGLASSVLVSLLKGSIGGTYGGEDHEILMTTVMKALAFAADDRFEEGLVEARRTQVFSQLLETVHLDFQEQYQRELAQQADSLLQGGDRALEDFPYVDSIFGRYMGAHLYRTQGQPDDARIDLERLPRDIVRSDEAPDGVVDLGDGRPVLSVVGLLGRSPRKQPVTFRVITLPAKNVAHVVADGDPSGAILSTFLWGADRTMLIKFEVPRMVASPPLVREVEVRIDGESVGRLGLVEDLGIIAEANFSRKVPAIYLRTLIRVIFKAWATTKGVDAVVGKSETGKVLGDIFGAIFNEISEAADVRGTALVPDEIHALDRPLDPGTYDVEILMYGPSGAVIGRDRYPELVIDADDRWIVLPVADHRAMVDPVLP